MAPLGCGFVCPQCREALHFESPEFLHAPALTVALEEMFIHMKKHREE